MNSNIPEKTDLRSVSYSNDEIDFIEVIGTIWRFRLIVVSFLVLSFVGSLIYAMTRTPPAVSKSPSYNYRAEVSFYCPADQVSGKSLGFAAQEYFKSSEFFRKASNEFHFLEAYGASESPSIPEIEQRIIYNKMLQTVYDPRSEILQVSFTHKNESIALGFLQLMNNEAETKIKNLNPKLMFHRLSEPSIVGTDDNQIYLPGPTKTKQQTGKSKIVITATMFGLIFSLIVIFLLNQIQKIKKDPVALSKLKGTSSL